MRTLTEKQKQEIQGMVESAKWELERAEPVQRTHPMGMGGMEKSVFLGTVFSLMPSGKYYTPWANSNVDPCPTCKGRGRIPNLDRNSLIWGLFQDVEGDLRSVMLTEIGSPATWPESFRHLLDKVEGIKNRFQDIIECPTCNGIGSEEACLDELFSEELEKQLEEIGAFLESGEGDPCDLFAVTFAEEEEEA